MSVKPNFCYTMPAVVLLQVFPDVLSQVDVIEGYLSHFGLVARHVYRLFAQKNRGMISWAKYNPTSIFDNPEKQFVLLRRSLGFFPAACCYNSIALKKATACTA
jgi:hypothetical protein